jgi:hypothetical protein
MAATDYGDAPRTAAAQCAADWPSDPVMQQHCVRRQTEAIRELRQRNGSLSNQSKRIDCAKQWPDDYRMRVYCENH